MKKRKRKAAGAFGFSITEWGVIVGMIVAIGGSIVTGVQYVERKFAVIDQILVRLDQMDGRLHTIETELKKTSDLLNSYLTWRFI